MRIFINNNNTNLTNDEKKQMLNKLKENSGFGLMLCKEALEKNNYNFDSASQWLIDIRKHKPHIIFY